MTSPLRPSEPLSTTPPEGRPPRTGLAVAILAAPLAWAVHISIGVALVPQACHLGTRVWLYLLTLVLLGVAAAGAVATRRLTVTAPSEPDRFMARIGWWSSLMAIVLILLGGGLVIGLDPCPP